MRWLFMAVMASCMMTGCGPSPDESTRVSTATNATTAVDSTAPTNQARGGEGDDAALRAALDYAAKAREARLQGKPLPPSMSHLPNFNSGRYCRDLLVLIFTRSMIDTQNTYYASTM